MLRANRRRACRRCRHRGPDCGRTLAGAAGAAHEDLTVLHRPNRGRKSPPVHWRAGTVRASDRHPSSNHLRAGRRLL